MGARPQLKRSQCRTSCCCFLSERSAPAWKIRVQEGAVPPILPSKTRPSTRTTTASMHRFIKYLISTSAVLSYGKQRGSRLYKRQKKLVFAQRLNDWKRSATRRADFLMCGIGSEARGFLHNKGAVVSEALVPFGPARPFQGGCDPLDFE